MSEAKVIPLRRRDEPARERVRDDLDTSLFVEAGAGSGKTTELVRRMVALVASGTAPVEQIAAVTFTRKAAAELRERFQTRLEEEIRARRGEPGGGEDEEIGRLRRGLEGIDRCFIGTIHAFCARLLRERPLEAGLDPAFEELPVEQRAAMRRRFWDAFLERLTRDVDPALERLAAVGLRPTALRGLFEILVDNPDVRFPAEAVEPPPAEELARARAELEGIVDAGLALMPDREPAGGWDSLQRKLRSLWFTRDVTGWSDPSALLAAIAKLCKPGPRGHPIVQKRWTDKTAAKDLAARADAFGVGDTPARALVGRWLAHRYALAVEVARRGAEEFAEYRRRVGKLDFQDLLMLSARLLRAHPHVRRELGSRYRRLLVDEFQDTDPLQAEIMLLLASDPAPAAEGAEGVEADWRTATPRPGALFVVGDPKQSIYRFRRADIQLYDFVKRRFGTFGAVLELTTNFRSRPPVGDLVSGVFDTPELFPRTSTPEQAAFEPLNTRPTPEGGREGGIFWYGLAPKSRASAVVAEDDAARLATWIAGRVAAGDRTPGDFLILTRLKKNLDAYARALEAHGVPVQVTGASVGMDEEIHELTQLLECLIDPTNPVKVLAALVGLFFGFDYERLVEHRLAGGSLDAVRPGEEGHPEVVSALELLHRWWRRSAAEPADVFIEQLVAELGLLPHAAGGELGTIRAGAVVYALDAVRRAALAGDASLPGAVDALSAAFHDVPEAEAPLQPGRADVVRLMNLHQAKGLEGTVVVLADPSGRGGFDPESHTVRTPEGEALGWVAVTEASADKHRSRAPLAHPEGWDALLEAERRFEAAEEVRLLYVAVTRAKEELVVSRWPDGGDESAWRPLDRWLDANAQKLELEAAPAEAAAVVDLSPTEVDARVREARGRVERMADPSFRHVSVTRLAKGGAGAASDAADPGDGGAAPGEPAVGAPADFAAHAPAVTDRSGFRGFSWGSAVHGALAAAASSTGERLRSECRTLLVESGRPLDEHGEPVELDELLELVVAVRASELWQRAEASERVLREVPFAAPLSAAGESARGVRTASGPVAASGRPQLELFGAARESTLPSSAGQGARPDAAQGDVLEGVVDLAFREPDGWVIADYKTDVGTDPEFAARVEAYRRQVELYAAAWTRLTGEPVKERVLLFTAQGRAEAW